MKGLRIAVTGPPGCGKTTLIRRVVEQLKGRMSIGGIYTEELREGRERKGFSIVDIATGKRGLLAHVALKVKNAPRLGRYRINLQGIEEVAVPAIEEALRTKELIVIDEIAPMELKSSGFIRAVEEALESPKHLLFAIHRRADHPLLRRIRREFTVYELTPANRDRLPEEIAALIAKDRQ